jgi:hypothetical protein
VNNEITGERAAENQSLYRSINERIKELNEVFEEVAALRSEWICECADTDCTTRILASLYEYEAVRGNGRTFIVYPGHVYPNVERIVDEGEHFVIVEKFDNGGELAEALDPRHTDGVGL